MGQQTEIRIRLREAVRLTKRLLRFALPHWQLILLTLTGAAITAASEGGYLLLIRPFMDKTLAQDNVSDALRSGIRISKYLMLLAPAMAIGVIMNEFFCQRTLWSVIVDIRNGLCRALLPQSLRYFETRRSGDFISRVTNDVRSTESALQFVFGDVLLETARLLVALGVAFYICWELAILSLLMLIVISVPVSVLGRRIRTAGKRSLEKLSDITDAMSQMFTGIRIVKAFQMEKAEVEEFDGHNRNFFRQMMRVARAKAISKSSVVLITRLCVGVLILLGCLLVLNGRWGLDWGGLATFVGCSFIMYSAARTLAKNYNDLQQALAGAERIFEVLDSVPEIADKPGAVPVSATHGTIAFRNVGFAYGTEPILRDINLDVRRGETIAIVGRSGAGKSTLVNLIPRFYDPTEGSVLFDGIDLRDVRRDSLISQIAVVTQQTFLFNRSIADNIRYGRNGSATSEEIEAAAQAANIHDFVTTLPAGYETEVGELGVRMSGGQRQRIAIARAILKDAPILILDEAMVGLDAESETSVRDAISKLMKGRTTFLIAHDLTEVRHADRIVVLKDGRIVESGSHDQLVARNGEYQYLLGLQMGNARP